MGHRERGETPNTNDVEDKEGQLKREEGQAWVRSGVKTPTSTTHISVGNTEMLKETITPKDLVWYRRNEGEKCNNVEPQVIKYLVCSVGVWCQVDQ